MKIGIVTIFNVPNYGAMLQCWSLCNAIKNLGHEPILIYIPVTPGEKTFSHKVRDILQYKFKQDFVKHNLPYTADLTTEVDAYLVGSDQVWNPNIVGSQLDQFLVNFALKDKPIASFASSFGLEKWPLPDKIESTRNYLSRFKIISVREKSGVDLLKNTFDLNAEEVLDPCFLTDDYSSLFSPDENPSDVVFFRLRPWKDMLYKEVEEEANKRGLSFFNVSAHSFIPHLNRTIRGYNEKYYSVSTWLKKISSAKYVITDSFHGLVFSLIFKRQFAVINSKPEAITRMESLLSKFGLQRRIVKNSEDAFNLISNEHIDYDSIGPKLDMLKDKSRGKLKDIIGLFCKSK
ncbi:MAG: polysaccharide pyruvyl transferase family protein [Muribaculaceae bacterium]|nr:polysaccharide pyruvyl transferase family protein [Muribaculaceae bacterium]